MENNLPNIPQTTPEKITGNNLPNISENIPEKTQTIIPENNLSEAAPAGENKNKKLLILVPIIFVVIILLIVGGFFYLSKTKNNSVSSGNSISPSNSLGGKTSTGSSLCDAQYDKLLAAHKLDESLCAQTAVRTGSFTDANIPKAKTNIVLIFDSSGSMATKIDGKSKIDIAKEATNNFVEKIKDSGANLSMIVYGHKGSNSPKDKPASCAGIDEVYWFDVIKPDIIKAKFSSAVPTGWTPIASALEKAKGILLTKASKNDNNIILLVSDGEETCGGNPVEVTKGIKSANFNIKVNVIGFDVGGTTEDQLRSIAEAGDGKFSSVKNAKDFEAIFQQQENMVNKMDFAVGRGVEQLYDISSAVLSYNQCVMMLNLEEAGVMLNVEAGTSPDCKTKVEERYFKRYDEMKNNFQTTFESEKTNFNNVVNAK